jgi:nicotinamide-nucleotide amidase
VGLVCFSVCSRDGARLSRSAQLPGGRADIRDRATTVTMHLLRRLLLGEADSSLGSGGPAAAASAFPSRE